MSSEQTTTPTASPSKSERDATVDAVNHLIQGKRHLLVRDISSAVNSLQEACHILAQCYGEVADECGDAYFHYGSALLELSRKESGILGNEKVGSGSEQEESEEENEDEDNEDDDEEESADDDESEKSSEKVDQDTAKGTTKEASKMGGTVEAVGEMAKARAVVDKVETKSSPSKEESKKTPSQDDSEAKSEDLDSSKKADESTVLEEKINSVASECGKEADHAVSKEKPEVSWSAQVPATAGASTSADISQPGSSQEKPPDEEDEVTTLQLSWEILELSKVIFKRQSTNNREMQLRLAQVHLKLGEVAMESENYKQSIEDLLECFKIQHALLPADDRSIAEVYYQLGLAYTFDLQFDLAIESFKNSAQTLKDRISNVQKVADCNGTSEKEVDAAYNAKKEIEELNELLPEILEKITDTEYLKKHDLKLPEELNKDLVPEQFKEEIETVDSSFTPTCSPSKIPKPVSSIAHLVRKKRKPEEEDVGNNAGIGKESKRLRSSVDELGSANLSNDASSTFGISNGTSRMGCSQIGDPGKPIENAHGTQSDTPVSST